MVNSEDFSKRLKMIFDHYDLSASSFADKIDVGRASISHILSGRNKPSLDFVMKVVSAFDDVELYWLLNGKGHFPSSSHKEISTAVDPEEESQEEEKENPQSTLLESIEQKQMPSNKKTIKKVIIFYSDGSFESYENPL
jgi:transcriptional regulator with XRE-family HTH domain